MATQGIVIVNPGGTNPGGYDAAFTNLQDATNHYAGVLTGDCIIEIETGTYTTQVRAVSAQTTSPTARLIYRARAGSEHGGIPGQGVVQQASVASGEGVMSWFSGIRHVHVIGINVEVSGGVASGFRFWGSATPDSGEFLVENCIVYGSADDSEKAANTFDPGEALEAEFSKILFRNTAMLSMSNGLRNRFTWTQPSTFMRAENCTLARGGGAGGGTGYEAWIAVNCYCSESFDTGGSFSNLGVGSSNNASGDGFGDITGALVADQLTGVADSGVGSWDPHLKAGNVLEAAGVAIGATGDWPANTKDYEGDTRPSPPSVGADDVGAVGPSIGSLDADAGGQPTQTTLPAGAEAANVANADTGLVWFAVYAQGSTPTPAEIKAGTGAVGNSQSAAVAGDPDASVVTAAPFTGLEGSTNYDLWAVAELPTDTFGTAVSDGFTTAAVNTELRFTMQDEFGSPLLNQTSIEYALFLAPANLGAWVPGTPAFQANNGTTSATGEFVLDTTGTWADGISVMCLYWQKGSPDKVSLTFETVSLT